MVLAPVGLPHPHEGPVLGTVLQLVLFDNVPVVQVNVVFLQGLPPDDGLVPVEFNDLSGVVACSEHSGFVYPFNKEMSGNHVLVFPSVI